MQVRINDHTFAGNRAVFNARSHILKTERELSEVVKHFGLDAEHLGNGVGAVLAHL